MDVFVGPGRRSVDIACSEDESAVIEIWSQSLYSSFLKFVDQNTLDEVHQYWTKYANFANIPDGVLAEIKRKQSSTTNVMLTRLGPTHNATVARSITLPTIREDEMNPTWVYANQTRPEFSIHSGSFLETYHLVEPFISDKRDMGRNFSSCLDKARQQFKSGCESFQASLHEGKITLRFYTGDPLHFTLALQSKYETLYRYSGPWNAKSINLSPHFSSSPPEKFDVIDTTRFIDTRGL
ncbi:hypothetical protein B0J17DRAFT_718479 [Rhizoctonia solani]|nr:hypothetical protein B0J17DRAFT_718479 [Rhizoctonia solani]